MPRRRSSFDESNMLNTGTYSQYLHRLTELSLSMFEWENLPETVDQRFLELTLFHDGQAVFFEDKDLGFLCLQVAMNGGFNVYRIPVKRRAYAVNGYNKDLSIDNSVIIYNNYLHTNSIYHVKEYARRLYNLDRIIDINANAQKTPILIQASETQRLTLKNLYMQWEGNYPVIYGDKNLDIDGLKVLKTDAPYIADKIYDLKSKVWNEALTYLGISNLSIQKKERLVSDEVVRSQGGTIASRYSRLQARKEAAEKINNMFGLDIKVSFREDFGEDNSENTDNPSDEMG